MTDDKFILTSLNDENSKHIAGVLGNKTCKKMLDFLADTKEASEQDIAKGLDVPINTIEYNLKKLTKSGLVSKTKNFFWSVKGRKINMYKLAKKHIIISPNKKPNLNYLKSILPVIFVAALLVALIGLVILQEKGIIEPDQSQFKKFNSDIQMRNFIKENSEQYRGGFFEGIGVIGVAKTSAQAETADTSSDYSKTNIQVEGVDEADIVKNDGKYIYVVSGQKVVIVNAYPAEDMEALSEIEFDENIREIFINNDKLIIFSYQDVYIYDVLDKEEPKLEEEIFLDGTYVNSRMIGKYVYIISTKYADRNNPEPPVFIMGTGGASNIYVSEKNIYLTSYNMRYDEKIEETIVHKININKEDIEYIGSGGVPGNVLNQFSMDEFDDYFRIATTSGDFWEGTSMNNLYILDKDLEIVGSVEGLAEGEKIYSARFMGKRAYIVTFKKVDPLFVIDVADPENPEVLGYLKITGYSDYLHPYDENHVIGIGKETIVASDEDINRRNLQFAWYQGVKVSLFDVSDVENPIEVDKIEIGDRGTDSAALHEHKAVLFDKQKNLLVIPISLSEIDEGKYDGYEEIPPTARGERVWEGVYVLNVDLDGISLRGKITHNEFEPNEDEYIRFPYQNQIKRSLYMDDILYTISQAKIKANDLNDIDEINVLDLGYEGYSRPIYYDA